MRKAAFVIAVSVALLGGCASMIIEQKYYKSYSVGQEVTANTGSVMLVDQNGYVTRRRIWVGILNSPDGYRTIEEVSANYYRKELIYSGLSGSTIELNYREFRQGYAAPAFYQSVKYDLSQSKTVQFQNFEVEVVKADNSQIKYKILHD